MRLKGVVTYLHLFIRVLSTGCFYSSAPLRHGITHEELADLKSKGKALFSIPNQNNNILKVSFSLITDLSTRIIKKKRRSKERDGERKREVKERDMERQK